MSIYESVFKDLFLTILELIDYSYSEMLNDNVEFHLNESGSDSLNDMHLENSITNRLVVYIQKNKIRYGLEILGFEVEPASDLSKEFATKGFIDIKVSNITTYFYNFTDVKEKMYVPNGNCMLDNNYKWLEFYNYNSKVKLTAFYNEKNEILEWYFDIAREIGKENGIPYEDDLYLDVVVTPKGEIMLLDEDELKDALDRMEITEKDFEDANREARELISKLRNKKDELKEFTDKYLKEMLK